MTANDFEVKTLEWAKRPGLFGPAVIHKATGEIVSGAWVEGTEVEVVELQRGDRVRIAASVTTPDGSHHYSYLD